MDGNKHIKYENSIKKLGLSIDWDREVSTCNKYYKHQQAFF